MSLPYLTGTGRLTAEPELRFAPSGVAVCKVNLAFNSRKKDEASGEWVDGDVMFVTGTVFKELAESVAESLTKGTEVVVSGRLKTRSYEKDGEKRSVIELMVDSIGPSLRYATAKVQKMQRGSQQPGGGFADDPWATASPGRPASADTSRGSFDDDAPPF